MSGTSTRVRFQAAAPHGTKRERLEATCDLHDVTIMEVGDGVMVPVARRGHMVALKVLARSERRPQDDQDLGALLHNIDDEELARAREALAAIEARGFARGKNLTDELDTQLARWRTTGDRRSP